MCKPVISVCLITYNQAEFIEQALKSILMQRHPYTWEIIIADDYSTDRTREIINNYYSQYSETIKLLFQPKNVGPPKNYIDLLRAAKGKYVAYLEGDDYWTDELKLDKQVKFLEQNKDFVACFHNVSRLQNGQLNGVVYPNDRKVEVEFTDLAKGDYLKSCSLMYRNSIETIDPLINFQIPSEDTSLGLCLLQKGKAYFMNETMATYRLHTGGTFSQIGSSKKLLWSISSQEALIKYFSFRSEKKYLIQTKLRYTLQLATAYIEEKKYAEFAKIFLKNIISALYYRVPLKEVIYPLYFFVKRKK